MILKYDSSSDDSMEDTTYKPLKTDSEIAKEKAEKEQKEKEKMKEGREDLLRRFKPDEILSKGPNTEDKTYKESLTQCFVMLKDDNFLDPATSSNVNEEKRKMGKYLKSLETGNNLSSISFESY